MKKSVSWSKDLESIIEYKQVQILDIPPKIKRKFSWSNILCLIKQKISNKNEEYDDDYYHDRLFTKKPKNH
jgi:hypothetical protein